MVNYTVLTATVVCQHILMPAVNCRGKNKQQEQTASVACAFSNERFNIFSFPFFSFIKIPLIYFRLIKLLSDLVLNWCLSVLKHSNTNNQFNIWIIYFKLGVERDCFIPGLFLGPGWSDKC